MPTPPVRCGAVRCGHARVSTLLCQAVRVLPNLMEDGFSRGTPWELTGYSRGTHGAPPARHAPPAHSAPPAPMLRAVWCCVASKRSITSYKLHTKQDRSARHHACCLLPDTMRAICCCLPSVSCMLPGACCMLHDARCMMNDSDACCTLHAAHCMLHVACRLLYGVCCLLYVAQFVLSVACCMLHAALVPTAPTTAGELSRFSPSSLPAA